MITQNLAGLLITAETDGSVLNDVSYLLACPLQSLDQRTVYKIRVPWVGVQRALSLWKMHCAGLNLESEELAEFREFLQKYKIVDMAQFDL